MKKILFFVSMLLVLLIPLPGNSAGYYGGGGVSTDTNCDQAKYHGLGRLCQDTDNGNLYKGTGAAIVEIAAGSSGDFLADGTVPMTGILDAALGIYTKNGETSPGFVDFFEDGSNGSSYARLYGPVSLAGNISWTLPGTALARGSFLIGSSTANTFGWLTVGEAGKIITTDGTDPAWSAYTIAAPGSAGAVLYSDGTNWTRSATPALQALNLTGANALAIGTSRTNDGKIIISSGTALNDYLFTIQASNFGADLTWTLPAAVPGGANYLLNVDADGTMGYTDPATFQPADADLTTYASITPSADIQALLASDDYATALSNLGGQASDSALTTLSSKTFSKTALTGTGGLDTVLYDDLADGDIGMVGTVAGVIYWYVFEASSSAAESSPSVIAPDDVGVNNGRWLLKLYCDGSSCTVPQAATGSYQTLLEGSAGGTNFRRTSVPDALTADLNLQHPDALPTANQFQLFPAPTDGVSAYTWTTYGAFAALPISTTGTISGGALTPVIGDADDFDNNFTGANLYGGTYIVNAAGSVILANAAVGVNFTILLEDAVATIIEPLATGTDDTIVLNGTALTQGASIQSSTKGAMCVFQYRAADSWMATCNGFIVTP